MEPLGTAVVVEFLTCVVIGAAAAPFGTCCAWLALPALLYDEAPRRYLDSDPGGGRLLPPVEVDAMPDEAAVDAVPTLLPPATAWGDEKDTARDVPSALLLPAVREVASFRPSRVLLVVRRKGWAPVGSMLLPLIMVVPFCTFAVWALLDLLDRAAVGF